MKFYACTTFILTNSCGEEQHLRVTATKQLSGSLHPHLWLYIYGYMCVLLCVNYQINGHLTILSYVMAICFSANQFTQGLVIHFGAQVSEPYFFLVRANFPPEGANIF